ncbi:MAG: LysR family transcriptional regulator [Archangium sp.]|nr:LysR family transcriptional regulator [Archangium sp.]
MSLDLESLKVFARVAALQSFTEASRQLGMPKARASALVQRLEATVGAQLLHRSTRVVRLTPEGEQVLQRLPAFLAEAEELTTLFQAGRGVRGRVRVELPVRVAVDFVIPHLPDLLARHPQLEVEIFASDRIASAHREGYDLVLRIGPVRDPALVGRKLGESPMMNCASPAYLRHRGTPRTLEDLRQHLVVHYAADAEPNFEYREGTTYRELAMKRAVTVDNFEAYEAACVAGLGIAQLPRYGVERHGGRLVEVLPEFTARPVPISILHTHGRSPPRRVKAVMSWLIGLMEPILGAVKSASTTAPSSRAAG